MSLEDVCALICTYNEDRTIQNIVSETKKYVGKVVVVDDGSEDWTAKRAVESGATLLHHDRNTGKGAALKTGFNYILKRDYNYIVTLDADGQHLPEEIPLFVEKIKEGYDAVIGKRDFRTKRMPFTRKMGNLLDSYILSKLLHEDVYDAQSGFRMFRKDALWSVYNRVGDNDFPYEAGLLIKLIKNDFKVGWVETSTIYYHDRESKIKPFKHTYNSLKLYIKCLRGKI